MENVFFVVRQKGFRPQRGRRVMSTRRADFGRGIVHKKLYPRQPARWFMSFRAHRSANPVWDHYRPTGSVSLGDVPIHLSVCDPAIADLLRRAPVIEVFKGLSHCSRPPALSVSTPLPILSQAVYVTEVAKICNQETFPVSGFTRVPSIPQLSSLAVAECGNGLKGIWNGISRKGGEKECRWDWNATQAITPAVNPSRGLALSQPVIRQTLRDAETRGLAH
jgi:hypothetical protein